MKTAIIVLFLLPLFISCNSQNQSDSICNSFGLYTPATGQLQNNQYDSLFYTTFFNAIDSMDIKKGYDLLIEEGFERKDIYGGCFLLVPRESSKTAIDYYLAYRFSFAQNDIDINNLRLLLVESYTLLKKMNESSVCLEFLLEMENSFLKFYDDNNNCIANAATIKEFEKYIRDKKNKRAVFLWAKLNMDIGFISEGMFWFKDLINEGKYKGQVYNELINYYSVKNSDSSKYYVALLSSEFKKKCNLYMTDSISAFVFDSDFLKEYNSCICTKSSKDSIFANVFLTKYFIENKNIEKAKIKINEYFASDSSFSFSSSQEWERRQYFVMKSQILFLEKQYQDLIKFIKDETGNGQILAIRDNNDLKKFIFSLYTDIYTKDVDTEGFEDFYRTNILPVM